MLRDLCQDLKLTDVPSIDTYFFKVLVIGLHHFN